MANNDDWAIVVGIGEYPNWNGLDALEGAERDARAFHDWVTDPAGGAVPIDQAELLVTSDFKPFASPMDAEPSKAKIDGQVRELASRMNGARVGRRVYIYVSSHGFSPPDPDDIGCLTAEASDMFNMNIHANGVADVFFMKGLFDEVVLFADCCRTSIRQASLMNSGASNAVNAAVIGGRKRLYGFAASMTQKAMEVPDENGNKRGVFTMALLDGLRGKAESSGATTVNSQDLERFLNFSMKDYLPDALKELKEHFSPHIRHEIGGNPPIEFGPVAPDRATFDLDL
ncbi:MAG: caspase family protein, partial [Pseudomonadota bacterium]